METNKPYKKKTYVKKDSWNQESTETRKFEGELMEYFGNKVSTEDQFLNDKVHSILLLDATGSQKGVAMQNMVYMLSKGGFYFFDRINKLIAIQKTSYATEFSAFEGNLK